MNSLIRMALLHELKDTLRKHDPQTKSEVPFSDIMPTNRRFRADFYCPSLRLIIEINGGQFIAGRHTRGGKGYENDLEKLNLASLNGFKILQFTYEMLQRNEHKHMLQYINR